MDVMMAHRNIRRFKPMSLSDAQINDLDDDKLLSFVTSDNLRKHDITYHQAIAKLTRIEDGLAKHKFSNISSRLHEKVDDAKYQVVELVELIKETREALHSEADLRKIREGTKPPDLSKAIVKPRFNGSAGLNHYYEFEKKFRNWCKSTGARFDSSSPYLLQCLEDPAKKEIEEMPKGNIKMKFQVDKM